MPLPQAVRDHAERLLFEFCLLRVPERMRSWYHLKFRTRLNTLTLYECRAPRDARSGQWTKSPCAQFRFDPEQAMWTLYWAGRNGRWFLYDDLAPTPDIARLIAEVDANPGGVFFG